MIKISQYSTGSVDVFTAMATVGGHSTLWSENISVGDAFKIDDESTVYQVASVDSNTQITLSANFAGTTATYQSYQITTDFTPIHEYAEIHMGDLDWPDWYTDALRDIDADVDRYGTSFPSSPVTSERLYRTDENIVYVYTPYHGGGYWQPVSTVDLFFCKTGAAVAATNCDGSLVLETHYIQKVYIASGQAPTTSGITVDVNINQASIFSAAADLPCIAAGGTIDSATPTGTTKVHYGDILTYDIDGVGSGSPGGSNLYVTIRLA